MSIGLIWAQAEDRVIGHGGTLPWHLPEDLAHFKQVTAGATVIMGRKSWESLPERFRPLPGRRNIVITRQAGFLADGAESAHSLTEALALAGDSPVWVIGGGEIYGLALERADTLEVTEIRATVDGDTRAPLLDDRWQVTACDPAEGWHTSRTGLDYRFLRYTPARQPR